MKIKRFRLEKLTEKTLEVSGAINGFASNKTVFLLQENMQALGKWNNTWTVKYYENDSFGLLNGIIYLVNQSEKEGIEIYFPETDKNEAWLLKFDKGMSFSQISSTINEICYNNVSC